MMLAVISTVPLVAVVTVHTVATWLHQNLPIPTWIVLVLTAIPPLLLFAVYMLSFAELQRGTLRCRNLRRSQKVALRRLIEAEIYDRSGKSNARGRKARKLVMRLRDRQGGEVWLPLDSWNDEDLLMAVVLRSTVDCRVRIEGDPDAVLRFSGLLDSYKSWDRQQAAA